VTTASPGPMLPAWEPEWEFTGDLLHARVMAGRLAGSPVFNCPAQDAKKARPGVYPVRDRKDRSGERPPHAEVPIGLVRDVVLDHVTRAQTPTEESIRLAAVRSAAPRELADGSAQAVAAGVTGYRGVLQRLRAEGQLARDAVLVPDVVVSDTHVDGAVVEWAAWGLHWIDRDGTRESHLLVWRDAGSRPRPDAVLGVIARAGAEGFRAEPISSWATRYQPSSVQPPAVSRVRIREVGLLDGSDAVLFDGSAREARELFDRAVPAALPALAGAAFLPGRGCAGCSIRPECRGLARVPGVLAVAGRAPYARALSTSDLWRHGVCARQSYLMADLGLPREPLPDLPAARRGQLVHAWLEAAHARGVPCAADDLPTDSHVGPVALALGWGAADASLAAPYLAQHLDRCPVTGEEGEVVRPECAITVHDTDADVVVTTRPDLVTARDGAAGRRVVVRETKTINLRRIEADEELGLLHLFPQAALALCLLAEGVDPLEPLARISPEGACVELELLGADDATVVSFAADDPDAVLAARVALAEKVDAWVHDDEHAPRPGRHCERCPVRQWCDVGARAAGYQPLDEVELISAADVMGVMGAADAIPLDVLALIEADSGAAVDEEFPF